MAKIKIKILSDKEIQKIFLKAKKTLDNNVIISDHPELDISLLVQKNKIIAMPKDQLDDEIYDAQMRLFKFLAAAGVIDRESVQAGNIFMSMEAKVLKMDDGDAVQHVLYSIYNFFQDDLPYYEDQKQFEEEMEDSLLDPETDEYSEFDASRHDEKKGTLGTHSKYQQYGIGAYYRI